MGALEFEWTRTRRYPIHEEGSWKQSRTEGVSSLLGIREELIILGVGLDAICDGEDK